MMQSFLFYLFFFQVASSYGNPSDSLALFVKERASFVSLTAPLGHHFNLKAPLEMSPREKWRLQKKSKQELVYVPKSMSFKKINWSFSAYLCDSAETYCRRVEQKSNTDMQIK